MKRITIPYLCLFLISCNDNSSKIDQYPISDSANQAVSTNTGGQKDSLSQIRANKLDKKSIMMYPVPNELTKGDFSIGWNTGLSEADKKFIAKLYKK